MHLFTIGHSNQDLEAFVAALRTHEIALVADVRRFPASRRLPHFSGAALAGSLAAHGITSVHLPDLGGRRTPKKDSRNTAWRNPGFRGYADYMDTPEFEGGIARLLDEASSRRVAIMCAERLWWQCHRGLIADSSRRGDTRSRTSCRRPAASRIPIRPPRGSWKGGSRTRVCCSRQAEMKARLYGGATSRFIDRSV